MAIFLRHGVAGCWHGSNYCEELTKYTLNAILLLHMRKHTFQATISEVTTMSVVMMANNQMLQW